MQMGQQTAVPINPGAAIRKNHRAVQHQPAEGVLGLICERPFLETRAPQRKFRRLQAHEPYFGRAVDRRFEDNCVTVHHRANDTGLAFDQFGGDGGQVDRSSGI